MTAPAVCRSCRARLRPAWRACLRCGTAVAAAGAPAPPPARRVPGRALAAALAATGLIVLVALPRSGGPTEAAAASVVSRPAAVSPVPTPVVGDTPTAAPPPSADPDRAGLSAYYQGDVAGAQALFEQAVERNPDDAESLSNLGQVLVRQGRHAEAIQLFTRAVRLNPERWAYWFNLARAHGLTGHWGAAVEAYEEAERLFPGDHATLFNLGLALQRLGDHPRAAAALARAAEADPDDASLLLPLGTSYERLARTNDAVRVYERFLELAPTAADAEAVRARLTQLAPGKGPGEQADPSSPAASPGV